jgi:hypothetical protein
MTEWEMLRNGREDEALRILQEKYEGDFCASTVVSLGVGYMWSRQYTAAFGLFQQYLDSQLIRKTKMQGDGDYAFLGSAMWCLGEFQRAVEVWKSGLKAPYSAGGVSVGLPILLLHASALRPQEFSREYAEKLLDNRIEKAWRKGWPLPVSKYLRGILDEAELEEAWRGPLSPNGLGILSQQEWQVDLYRWECAFHESFVRLTDGKDSILAFRTRMRTLADTSRPEWATEKQFAHLIRTPKFYLARCEAEATESS